MDLTTRRIVVTGGSGFLGRHVVEKLHSRGCQEVTVVRSSDHDLTIPSHVEAMYSMLRPDVVIHLAAVVGGIGINRDKPGTFFYKNLMMGTNLIEYGRLASLQKFVAIGTVCAYPKFTPVPFKESDLWCGYPEETNAAYGLAKKMMLVQSQAYRQEFGFNSIFLLPVNLYGPHDNFDPYSSHVIPALINKVTEAKKNNAPSITGWGTGSATREFLFVRDAAEAIVRATESYESSEPMNVGSGQEISIRDLVALISDLCGYTGRVIWDSSKPDGQPRRCLDIQRAAEQLGFTAQTSLPDGLRETIEWYNKNASKC